MVSDLLTICLSMKKMPRVRKHLVINEQQHWPKASSMLEDYFVMFAW